MVQNECNCVGLPLFLLDLLRVGNDLDPLHLHHVLHDAAPLNDRIPVGSLYPLVVGRRGDIPYIDIATNRGGLFPWCSSKWC